MVIIIIVPLVITLAGGLLLHFIVIPLFQKVANRFSISSRNRARVRYESLRREAAQITDMLRLINYKIDRNNSQLWTAIYLAFAIFSAIGAVVVVDSIKTIVRVIAIVGVVSVWYFIILAMVNLRKVLRMDTILRIAAGSSDDKGDPGSEVNRTFKKAKKAEAPPGVQPDLEAWHSEEDGDD
jgi:hypothetical protein